jgi:hypothetical protein
MGSGDKHVPYTLGYEIKKSKIFQGTKTDPRMVFFVFKVRHRFGKNLTGKCALIYIDKMLKYFKTPVAVCLLRVENGLPRGNG